MKIDINAEASAKRKELVEQGAWVGDLPEFPDVQLKVRGMSNVDARRMAQRLVMAVPREKKVPALDPIESDRINAVVMRECVLLDWRGIEGDDDQPMPFSKKKAAEYLQSEAFRNAVQFAADQVAAGIVLQSEEIAGN